MLTTRDKRNPSVFIICTLLVSGMALINTDCEGIWAYRSGKPQKRDIFTSYRNLCAPVMEECLRRAYFRAVSKKNSSLLIDAVSFSVSG